MELHFFLEQLDGQRRELVHPVSFSLVRSADTPADSLKAEFMVPDAQWTKSNMTPMCCFLFCVRSMRDNGQ